MGAALAVAALGCGSKGSTTSGGPASGSAPSASESASAPVGARAPLQIVRLADELEVFNTAMKDLPEGGTFLQETVPIGTTRQEVPKDMVEKICAGPVHCEERDGKMTVELPIGAAHTYLRVIAQPDESIDETAKRLDDYLKKLAPPTGARFAIGKLYELDEATKTQKPVGVRSYVLSGEPAVTEKDVVDALAKHDGPAMVEITLAPDAAGRLEAFTRQNQKRRIAVIVSGYVLTAPVVEGPITGGQIGIAMSAGDKATEQEIQEATRVADALRPPS